ncbi:MAG: rhodanese-like domain-containing protein, partial [Candidatus Atribacteria bacterium]|nr:rhodanese-like domain-containing protein [Candidatus Atribacteria bacterium]
MQLRKIYYLMLIIPLLFFYTGCSDNSTEPEETVNESEVLVKYLEDNGEVINTFAQMITADEVNSNILASKDQYIIDIRNENDFAAGHIKGAVRVDEKNVLEHYEENNLESKDVVVLVCVSGQTAGWVNGLLHTMSYTNARDLKWGMCSWNAETSGPWTGANVNNSRATEFVNTATPKPEAGNLPKLTTGKTKAEDILRARVEAVFAEGFIETKVSSDGVCDNLSNYFIANYWIEVDYNWGHIEGAMQYTKKASLTSDADLKTLATDKTVAVYCYTGQTSAHVAAYLRVLGYDAKSITYGVNGMSYN